MSAISFLILILIFFCFFFFFFGFSKTQGTKGVTGLGLLDDPATRGDQDVNSICEAQILPERNRRNKKLQSCHSSYNTYFSAMK